MMLHSLFSPTNAKHTTEIASKGMTVLLELFKINKTILETPKANATAFGTKDDRFSFFIITLIFYFN
jgi:hypothetical protein